ncbi:MAG: hypothetical protein M3068_05215 [Gemmatimonadota bacterium]|nr:hypothetical protein [Gemmatimonadota bacterium]
MTGIPQTRGAAGSLPEPEAIANKRRSGEQISQVRAADLEPYAGLRYLSKLFRLMALILLVLLAAEVATGLSSQGLGAAWTLIAEAGRLLVLAGVLWGVGDLAVLLIDVGHDVRAARILLGRYGPRPPSPPSSDPAHPASRESDIPR